jgi:hypothetical protein
MSNEFPKVEKKKGGGEIHTPRLATKSLRRLPMTSLFLRMVSTECSR